MLGVSDPQPDANGSSYLVSVEVEDGEAAGVSAVTDEAAAAHPDLDIRQAGDVTIDEAINEQVGEDLSRLFNQLSGYAPKSTFKRLLVAPRSVRSCRNERRLARLS